MIEENITMIENMIMIRDLKTFCFNFGQPKDVDENLNHEIEFIIKSNGPLAKKEKKQKQKQY